MNIEKIMNREKWVDFIISIILIFIGTILIVKPVNTLNFISIVLGIIVTIYGLFKILKYLKDKEQFGEELYNNNLIIGIMIIIFCVILFMYTSIIESLLRIMIGLWMVYNSLIKLVESRIFKEINKNMWLFFVISSIITILAGLYVILHSGAIIQIIGGIIIIYAILDIIEIILYNKNNK